MVEIIPLCISLIITTFVFIYGRKLKNIYVVSLILISALMMVYAIYSGKLIIGAYGAILLMVTCGICFVKWVWKCDGW